MSNDPETPNLALEISGEIVVDVAVTPRHLSFGQVGKGETVTREFELKINEPDKVKIVDVTVSDERFALERIEGDATGDSKYSVKLADTSVIGRVTGKVLVKIEGSESDSVEVPIRASVVGDLRYSRSMYFNKRDGKFPDREVAFTRRSGKDVQLKKVEDPDGLLKLDLPTKKGKKAIVSATVADPEKDYTKPVRGSLKVHVVDADEPVVEIRYTITDRPRRSMPNLGKRSGRLGKPVKPVKGKGEKALPVKSAAEAKPE
jgi:hypothetical protein